MKHPALKLGDSLSIREKDERFILMANHAPILLWMARTDSLCFFFNSTWTEFTGRTAAQEWGVGWAEGIHPQDFQPCMDTYFDAFNKREKFEMTYRLLHKDGEYRWILDRGIPIIEKGVFLGYIGSCADITELRKATDSLEASKTSLEAALNDSQKKEIALQQLTKELRRSNEELENFAFAASHDLQAPLRTVASFCSLIQEQLAGNMTPELKEYCDILINASSEMKDLIDDLLTYSRLDREKTIPFTRVDIPKLIAEIRSQDYASGSDIIIECKGIPAVSGSKVLIKTLLSNLLENSYKFKKPDQTVHITLTAERDEDIITIAVKDNGIGIPTEFHQKVFEMFSRCHFLNVGGKGIGLAICKKVTDIHDGRIWVDSAPNEGATFYFTLPAHDRTVSPR